MAEAQPNGRARGQGESGGGVAASPDMMRRNDDPNLTSSPGPPPPLPRQFTVRVTGPAAERWPSALGVFTRSERSWAGRPVYTNTEGRLLYLGGDHGWLIGRSIGMAALKGSRSRHSPESEDIWSYFTGSEWKPASVTVTVTASDDPILTSPGLRPPLPRQFTVTVTGAAAEKRPDCKGVFTWSVRSCDGKPVYSNTWGMILYHVPRGWVIGRALDGPLLRGSRGVSNNQDHHSPESEDSWIYWTGSDWEPASVTVTVTLPTQFIVSATGAAAVMYPSCQGVFTRSETTSFGKPVYTNTQGMALYHNGDGDWMIWGALRRSARGSRNRHNPASGGNWRYLTGSEWKPASVTVTAID